MVSEVRIGTSGWSYDHWAGVLYPVGMRKADRLARYPAEFDTVELNASFYRWPQVATFASWHGRLPEGFQMTVKAPRALTHAKRLLAPDDWVARMVGSWHELGDRRGLLLVQLHPQHVRRRPTGLLSGTATAMDEGGGGVSASQLG